MTIIRIGPAALLAVALLAGCASAPETAATDNRIIYVDEKTGEVVYPDDDPSDEELAMGALLGALTGALRPEALEEDEIWSVDTAGNATHIQSGLSCPKTWSQLSLTETHIFRQDGQDVGCNYIDGHGAIATLYAYHSGLPVEAEMQQIIDQVVKQRFPIHEDADVLNITEPGTSVSFVADAITFKGGDGRLMKSGLALADYSGWRVKARITYPEAIADEFEQFINLVMVGEHDQIAARQKQLQAITQDTEDDL